MAIQMRRGIFADFDTGKMIPGEFAVVLSGDSTTSTGKGVYICFASGDVQRLSTYEEMAASIQQALEDDPEFQQYVTSAVNDALDEHPEWRATVEDGSISSAKLATYAVITSKINDGAVTTNKIDTGAVTEAKLNEDVTTFTQASSRTNLTSGESIKTIWGKISKWFADLKTVAFSGSYSDLSNRPTLGDAASKSVANDLTTASAGSAVLDAYQGKILEDELHPAYADRVVPTMAANVSLYRNNCYRLGNFIMINMVLRVYATISNGGNLCNFSGVTVSSPQDIFMMQASTGRCYAAAFQAGTGNLNANGDLLGSESGTFYFLNGSLYAPLAQ